MKIVPYTIRVRDLVEGCRNDDEEGVVACGPMLLPPSVELAPYDDYYVSFLCEGGEESDSAGDVSVSGTFVENGTWETISSSNSLSVVRVEIKPTVVAPANDSVNRHSFGVCEYVEHRQYPSAPAVVWNPVGGGSNVVHGIKDCYRCPLDGCDNPLRAEIGSGMIFAIQSGLTAKAGSGCSSLTTGWSGRQMT